MLIDIRKLAGFLYVYKSKVIKFGHIFISNFCVAQVKLLSSHLMNNLFNGNIILYQQKKQKAEISTIFMQRKTFYIQVKI
ncbi:MAG: hypothetical protein EA412_10735 [Chitinophagaceae bacterium]|nr:MAG: hypothetical protein EA412_10735 [Chitinophagaceae bacterium]